MHLVTCDQLINAKKLSDDAMVICDAHQQNRLAFPGRSLFLKSNPGQIPVKFRSNPGQIPVKFLPNPGRIAVKFRSKDSH